MPRFVLLLALAVSCLPPATQAQPPPTMPATAPPGAPPNPNFSPGMPGAPTDDTTVTRGTTADPVEPTGPERPVLAYFLALIGSAGALLIVCTPSRKQS